MIDISLPPPKLLPQHTQQKRGREVYQDTDGNNVQDGYFFPDNSDIAIPNKGVRPIQTGRGYWGPAGYVRCNGLSSGTYNDKSYVFTFKYAHTNYSGFFMHGRGATGDRGTIRSRTVSGKMSFYHQDGTELDIVYTFVPGQIYTLVWVAPQSLLSDGKVYVNGIDATPAWDQTATGIIAVSDYMIGSSTIASNKSACTFIEHRFYLNILLTQNEAIEYHETGDIASKTPHVYYNYEEGTGTTTYNLIANSNHGSVLGLTTQTALHVAVDGARSAQNERGYWFSSDVEGVGAFTPIRYNSNTIDVLGRTPLDKYLGQVRYDEQIKGSSVGNFDGVLYGDFTGNTNYINANIQVSGHRIEINIEFDTLPAQTIVYNYSRVQSFQFGGFYIQQVSTGLQFWMADSSTTVASKTILGGLITGKMYNVVIEKRPSDAFLTVTVNGEDKGQVALNASTIYFNPGGHFWGVGCRYNVDGASHEKFLDAQIAYINHNTINDSGDTINSIADLQFSETSGIVVHNLGADRPANSDMSWVLGGSSDGAQWATSDLQYPKNLIEGFNKAGYLTNKRLTNVHKTDYRNDHCEIDLEIYIHNFDQRFVYGHMYERTTATINRCGWGMQIERTDQGDPGRLEFIHAGTSTSLLWVLSTSVCVLGYNAINVKLTLSGTTLTTDIILNGASEQIVTPNIYMWSGQTPLSSHDAMIGGITQNTDSSIITNYSKNIFVHKFNYYELNSSGVRINELISPDFNNGDADLVPNVAVNAPANSDSIWSATGVYALIPADPSNPIEPMRPNL
jgi:hypothetical protein